MVTYVAFLRAINVGGRTVNKRMLQSAVASLGFTDVSTFKQTGNVIFSSDVVDAESVETQIHDAVSDMLCYDVAVFVRTVAQLQALIKANPFGAQQKAAGESFQVTFLPTYIHFPLSLPMRIPNSTADLIGSDYREIFSITRGNGDGGKPNPFIEKTLKMQATTRNWNIILQLARCGN
jgi:uncharacterized protein (DUF1697 family)